MRPLCIDLFCGLGGWSEGFLAEGYECIGFDIECHDYGSGGYPGQLVLQDIRTLHGAQFKDATVIVASPPCQAYSYMAMPWSRAKAMAEEIRNDFHRYSALNDLFVECFRIQREACEAAGRYIPLIVENVRGAIPWVGRSRWHYGSFHLWGDVPALMPISRAAKVSGLGCSKFGTEDYKPQGFNVTAAQRFREEGQKSAGNSPLWKDREGGHFEGTYGQKNPGFRFDGSGRSFQSESANRQISPARRAKHYQDTDKAALQENGKKNGGDWFSSGEGCSVQRKASSRSNSRKAASAQIAKIPLPLSRHLARVFKP